MRPSVPVIHVFSLTLAEDRYTNAQQVNAREIASRLDPARFEFTLLSDGSGPAAIKALPHVRVVRLAAHRQAARILLRLLGGRFDILFYPGTGLPESLYLRLPRHLRYRRARVLAPVEGDVRQTDEIPGWRRRRVDRIYRTADALFPITEHVAQTLFERTGRTGEIVPVGVDLQTFRPRNTPRPPGPLRVLSVGTVKAWKRPELVRVAAERFRDARFVWLGDGELRTPEAAQAPANLSFPGACPRDRLPQEYHRADVLLHPSRMEGLPKVILEALASGVPVVAFDDYEPRFLSHAGAGFVVQSAEEMLVALGRLLADADLRARMGRAARTVANAFGWNVIAARWAAIFEREAALARSDWHRKDLGRRVAGGTVRCEHLRPQRHGVPPRPTPGLQGAELTWIDHSFPQRYTQPVVIPVMGERVHG